MPALALTSSVPSPTHSCCLVRDEEEIVALIELLWWPHADGPSAAPDRWLDDGHLEGGGDRILSLATLNHKVAKTR